MPNSIALTLSAQNGTGSGRSLESDLSFAHSP